LTTTLAGGRYRVERTLGRGGMAVVYLAVDEELGRPVAVKVLSGGLDADDSFRARFRREARVAARLSHPNIVRIYDVGEGDGTLYIVMEHVPGRTLADVGKVSPPEAVELIVQACAGVQHAHEAGLVHRDLKPANLLLREDGVLKIADFGIARATHCRWTVSPTAVRPANGRVSFPDMFTTSRTPCGPMTSDWGTHCMALKEGRKAW
jgi:serine/threonine-protein kinase